MIRVLDATGVLAICFCIVAEAAREVCFKAAALRAVPILTLPITWVGVCFWGIELLVWTWVLARVPLSIAFPLMAASYIVIALSGAAFFKETINARHAIGIGLVTIGVVIVGVTGV